MIVTSEEKQISDNIKRESHIYSSLMLKPGIYEQIINRILRNELNSLKDMELESEKVEKEDASYILSKYAGNIIQNALLQMRDTKNYSSNQVKLINKIIRSVSTDDMASKKS